jgi:hypothetical protein
MCLLIISWKTIARISIRDLFKNTERWEFSVDKNTYNVKGMLACGFEILDRGVQRSGGLLIIHRQIPSSYRTVLVHGTVRTAQTSNQADLLPGIVLYEYR